MFLRSCFLSFRNLVGPTLSYGRNTITICSCIPLYLYLNFNFNKPVSLLHSFLTFFHLKTHFVDKMSSMGSMPFVVDHIAIERSVVLSNQGCRNLVPLFRPRKSVTDLAFVCDSSSVTSGCRAPRIKATGENSSNVDTNDVTQVTIDKTSRKNFAMKADKQIVERRETTKSTGSTLINSEEETDPAFSNASYKLLSNSSIDPVEDELDDLSQSVTTKLYDDEKKNKTVDLPPDNPLDGEPESKSLLDASNGAYEKSEDITESILDEEADVPASDDVESPPLAGPNVMNVILVAAECAPWSKTGGLGDVAGALPKALAQRGHRVMVVVPLYGNYDGLQDTGIRRRYKVGWEDVDVDYFQTYIDGVDFVFIRCHMFNNLGSNIYGGNREDILRRMVLFCKAAVEVPWYVPCGGVCYGDGNLVFVANDWHTALLPVYLKAYYRDNGLMSYTRSILVIHNIAHQGRGPVDDFGHVDLPPHYLDLFRLYDPVGGEHFNIFAAGLKTADRVVTVSQGYSWELKTSEGGWGLHNIINENGWKLKGIVNGIDTKEWNPEVDAHLTSDGYTNYSLETLNTGKPQCKAALQKELGLPIRDDVPLIGFIGRLDVQKGVDLIGQSVPWIVDQDVQLVMLGTGRPDLEQMLREMENRHPDKIRGWVGFSVKMAHRITAGVDILLMPSRFEPCGLNQLYAMNYGTIPVVHAVGGLRDTVQPFDPFHESGLGWTFNRAEAGQLIHALGNCLLTYREYRQSWEGIQQRGMTQDLSWDNAAQNYEDVFVAAKYQW